MVKTLVWSARYGVPHMQKAGGGSIVNIASVHGLLMAPNTFAYEAGKSAVIGATKQMAIDFGPMGIRVNAICPGHIVTERNRSTIPCAPRRKTG
jgi:NAD(P)-dependent dehydrogenase (short-subunit alcohol dehydrogenase family)